MKALYFVSFITLINSSPLFSVEDGVSANDLVASADIFYINPNPRNKTTSIRIKDLNEVQNKSEIKLIIHGYYSEKDHVAVAPLRYAYLAKGSNTLYMADWSRASKLFYPTTRNLITKVAARLSEILDKFLKRHSIDHENVHIIGHSLGAHIAGIMGEQLNGRIGRITGLDPALPLFRMDSIDSLRPSQAKFVDVIHTDASVLADLTPRGHVDFYPNYGTVSQPGCAYLDVLTLTSCSHYRAPLFYAETIQLPTNFPSVKCNFSKIRTRSISECWNVPSKDVILMGENVSKEAQGTYFLETNNVPPYGLGFYSRRYADENETNQT